MNESSSGTGTRVLRPLGVLLVDDNPRDRDLIARELRRHFGTVELESAGDGRELDLALSSGTFDAAIVDYQLRWSTGIELLRRIRASRPGCPVIMFTASGNEAVAVEAMKEGLDDYITKSAKHYVRLPFALEACLERKHQREELDRALSARRELVEQVSASEQRLQLALRAAGMHAWESGAEEWADTPAGASNFPSVSWKAAVGTFGTIHLADLTRFVRAYLDSLRTREPFACEVRAQPENGPEVWLEVRGQPLCDDRGRLTRMIGVTTDITQRKRVEDAHAHLAAIVESSGDAIIGERLDGTVTSWNPGASALFGYSAEEMIGRSLNRIIPPERHGEEERLLTRLARGERIEHYDTERVARNGARIPVSVTISPIRDRSGAIIGASKVARDVSERKRAEEALRLADRRKDTFLATLAHELRNPLAPIRYATRLLEPGVPPQMAEDARRMIERQLGQMARLLDDLLDVSRITRGVLEIRRDIIDVREAIETAVTAAHPLAQAACIELTAQVPTGPLPVRGDTGRLAQVVGNLLSNAIKFTDAGGHVTLDAQVEQADILVRVRDDGIGISAELLPKVFDLFVQGEPTGVRAASGLGLGLSLARELIELHHGAIEAMSAGLGRGSEFVIRLPKAGEKPAVTEPVAAPEKVVALGASQVRVLIVDDNVDAARALSDVLTLAGYPTTVAHDGKTALDMAERQRPEVVLLDVGLPDMSGHDIAREIRDEPWGSRVQLIAITGWGREDDRNRSRAAGFDEHLTKPVDPEALLRLIARVARGAA